MLGDWLVKLLNQIQSFDGFTKTGSWNLVNQKMNEDSLQRFRIAELFVA